MHIYKQISGYRVTHSIRFSRLFREFQFPTTYYYHYYYVFVQLISTFQFCLAEYGITRYACFVINIWNTLKTFAHCWKLDKYESLNNFYSCSPKQCSVHIYFYTSCVVYRETHTHRRNMYIYTRTLLNKYPYLKLQDNLII